MKWSKDLPTKEGLYWWRVPDDSEIEGVDAVWVQQRLGKVICCSFDGSTCPVSELSDGHWCGPIPQPEEEPKSSIPITPTKNGDGPSGPRKESNDYA